MSDLLLAARILDLQLFSIAAAPEYLYRRPLFEARSGRFSAALKVDSSIVLRQAARRRSRISFC